MKYTFTEQPDGRFTLTIDDGAQPAIDDGAQPALDDGAQPAAVATPAVTPTVTQPAPPVATQPAPPVSAPTGPSDYEWDLLPVKLRPVYPLQGTGDYGASISFVADAGRYPTGFKISGVIEDNSNYSPDPVGPQDFVLSAEPHDFTPLNGNQAAMHAGAGVTMGPLYCVFRPAKKSYEIPVEHGRRYFLNFRSYVEPRGRCMAQVWCDAI